MVPVYGIGSIYKKPESFEIFTKEKKFLDSSCMNYLGVPSTEDLLYIAKNISIRPLDDSELQSVFDKAVKRDTHLDTLPPDPVTTAYVASKVSVHDAFSKLFKEVCDEIRALDPGDIENCTLQKTEYTQETLGAEIQEHNKRDPFCRLIRLDAARTYQLLRTDGEFRKLIYRTSLFNTSRDAAMRLKAQESTHTSIYPEYLALFRQFKDVFKNYISKSDEADDDLFVYELQRLYMSLLSFNYAPPENNLLSRAIASTGGLYPITDLITIMRMQETGSHFYSSYKNVIRYSSLHKFFFVPTYAPISIKTLIHAWASGIFFFGCTSKKEEMIHSFSSDPKFLFEHDEIHFSGYITKIPLHAFSSMYPDVQANAKKIITHIGELQRSDDVQQKELATVLEYVLFLLHHEAGCLFLKNDLTEISRAIKHVLELAESNERAPSHDVLWPAVSYYRDFVRKNFS